MFTRAGIALASLIALLGVASCGSNDNPKLLNLAASNDGPDEFSVLPTKPLQTPPSYRDLPVPTPGGTNITDSNPSSDAIIALGGKPGGGSAGSAALMNYALRYGVEANIRQTLYKEDLDWRKANDGRLLERLFNINVYFKAYNTMSLDQYRELERWRAAGRKTPAAPPNPNIE
ncbi:DUF3035 domain-containing protein [Falsihalocynthiibacter arcticus]|uniref:Pyruvate/2-oxoglutarate dehydrogenase complex, dihydrolipoamide acyltransferase (E2) component n=1 Tax=Falsihalocynthiibacter arcticus TaxID=1579316 RepID=A0A126UXG3_9RHOB|nr:DUF3035 domain-containing protein [Falsihalocynthiibacter arcticus]AML50762.1 pyruvate/2-oxoglutarate dehydrogenase complex, dihydrolipoamide acyltransferase (E2) component [Falsihalocynthiibacter arcticus]